MATKDAIEFWKDIAGTYGEFGTVLFDLFNEPWVYPDAEHPLNFNDPVQYECRSSIWNRNRKELRHWQGDTVW